jgi:hypothetical protein
VKTIPAEPASQAWSRGALLNGDVCVMSQFELVFLHHKTIGRHGRGPEINAVALDGLARSFAAFVPRKPNAGWLGAAAREAISKIAKPWAFCHRLKNLASKNLEAFEATR